MRACLINFFQNCCFLLELRVVRVVRVEVYLVNVEVMMGARHTKEHVITVP